MSKRAREKARENGQRSGKGRQWLSRIIAWTKSRLTNTGGKIGPMKRHILIIWASMIPFLAALGTVAVLEAEPFWWFVAGAIGVQMMDPVRNHLITATESESDGGSQ